MSVESDEYLCVIESVSQEWVDELWLDASIYKHVSFCEQMSDAGYKIRPMQFANPDPEAYLFLNIKIHYVFLISTSFPF